ncbi:MAG: two-component sensor histidine kinase [Deltaproteobacteria bacterium]|nr:two-component sensor histidine kinase [Deltaproteobacteria bacterium]
MQSEHTSAERKLVLLSWRTLVLFVVAALLVPAVVGVVTITTFRSAYEERATEHLTVLLRKHSKTIDSFLNARLGDIRTLARSHTTEALSSEPFLREQLAILREEYGGAIVDLGMIDAEGVQRAYAGPHRLAKAKYADAPWFAKAQENEEVTSDVFTGLRGTPHFVVAAAKASADGVWYLRATVDFQAFSSLVPNIREGRTGFAFILNREGELQTKPQHDVAVRTPPYSELLAKNLVPGEVHIERRRNSLGRDTLFGVVPLKGGQWLLCFQQEVADAHEPLRQAIWLTVAVLLVTGVAVSMAMVIFGRRLTRKLAVADAARKVLRDEVVEAGRLATIGELAAGIAHEINNPVAIMVEEAGWIEDLLADDEPASAENLKEFQRAVGQIKTQGGRCKEITHKLLSFARKTDPAVKEVHLNELIREIVGLVAQRAKYANVEVETELDEGLRPVKASPGEMQQVLLNLANNALDAMDKSGGMLTIRTRCAREHVELEVADNGVGIAKSNLPRLFDPFYTTKPVGKSTGLGLSICYGIVKKLGGDIRAESEKGKGTTFTIDLPLSGTPRARRQGLAEPTDEDDPAGSGDESNASGVKA